MRRVVPLFGFCATVLTVLVWSPTEILKATITDDDDGPFSGLYQQLEQDSRLPSRLDRSVGPDDPRRLMPGRGNPVAGADLAAVADARREQVLDVLAAEARVLAAEAASARRSVAALSKKLAEARSQVPESVEEQPVASASPRRAAKQHLAARKKARRVAVAIASWKSTNGTVEGAGAAGPDHRPAADQEPLPGHAPASEIATASKTAPRLASLALPPEPDDKRLPREPGPEKHKGLSTATAGWANRTPEHAHALRMLPGTELVTPASRLLIRLGREAADVRVATLASSASRPENMAVSPVAAPDVQLEEPPTAARFAVRAGGQYLATTPPVAELKNLALLKPLVSGASAARTFTGLTRREIVLRLQGKLAAIGCRPGTVDGKWGRKGQDALERAYHRMKIQIDSAVASREALVALDGLSGQICQLGCDENEILRAGRCVEKPQPVVNASVSRREQRAAQRRQQRAARRRRQRASVENNGPPDPPRKKWSAGVFASD